MTTIEKGVYGLLAALILAVAACMAVREKARVQRARNQPKTIKTRDVK